MYPEVIKFNCIKKYVSRMHALIFLSWRSGDIDFCLIILFLICMCIQICLKLHMRVHICGGRRLTSGIFLNCSLYCISRQGLSLNLVLTLLVHLGILFSEAPVSPPCDLILTMGPIIPTKHSHEFWGSKLRSSCFHSKCHTH